MANENGRMTNLERLQEVSSMKFKQILGFLIDGNCSKIRCCNCPFRSQGCPDMDFSSWCNEEVNQDADIWQKWFKSDEWADEHYYC